MNDMNTPINETVNQETKAPETAEATEKKKGKKKAGKIINTIINVVLIIAIVFAVICTYLAFTNTQGSGDPGIFGISFLSIQSDSMEPEFYVGDLIIDTKVDVNDLRKGDIITYWTIINGEKALNTHRIIEIYKDGEGENAHLIFETQGDNNDIADPLTVHEKNIIGKYKFKLPGVGKVLDYLQTPTGFLVVVVIPVFVFFIYHLVQFFRVLFEYQNVKNRIKYEQERGRTEDLLADQEKKLQESKEEERQKIEAELREKLKAELLMSMAAEKESKEEAPAESENEETEEEKSEESEKEEASDEKSEESDK